MEIFPKRFLHVALALLLAPLLLGVIQRVKARLAGRSGQPLLQPYWDFLKLTQKGAVYSRTTTWVFRAGPIVTLAGLLATLVLLPLGTEQALVSFPGDFVAVAALLALGRFFTVSAALDTGSAFEGMGASREVLFSALSEPALLLALSALAAQSGSLSLSGILPSLTSELWRHAGPALALALAALFVVYLTENARIPVDDPNTHLELTMIHEVMVLDHGGPDLAFILYSSALKLWVLGSMIVSLAVPLRTGNLWVDAAGFVGGMLLLAIITGMVESSMARLRLTRVPQLLAGAGALAAFSLALVLR